MLLVLAWIAWIATWWAMGVKLKARGKGWFQRNATAAGFASLQLVIMALLLGADSGWALLGYGFLMLATGNMVLEATHLRFPESRLGAWWGEQVRAAAARRAEKGGTEAVGEGRQPAEAGTVVDPEGREQP